VEIIDPLLSREAQELRDLWQGRALATASGTTAAVLLSVLSHNYDDAMPIMLRLVKPITWDDAHQTIKAPFLCSAARVEKNGTIVADVVNGNGTITKRAVLYVSETELRDAFRKLADKIKLTDDERCEMFKAVQRWVVADTRIDPTFDPQDPDAKRLVN